MYNLDRLDLSVVSTLDAQAQTAVTKVLRELRDPEVAKAAGLTGKGMLGNGDPANVVYSFTLLEKGEQPTCCACRRITSTSRWTSTKAPSWTSVPPPSCARW
jgi:hypothetical protein